MGSSNSIASVLCILVVRHCCLLWSLVLLLLLPLQRQLPVCMHASASWTPLRWKTCSGRGCAATKPSLYGPSFQPSPAPPRSPITLRKQRQRCVFLPCRLRCRRRMESCCTCAFLAATAATSPCHRRRCRLDPPLAPPPWPWPPPQQQQPNIRAAQVQDCCACPG